jgi:hypothetical protein
MKAYNEIAPASREQIDTVKANLIDALRERDSRGLCTLDVAGLAVQDNGYGPAAVWNAFYELFSEGLVMFALTRAGLRFSRCGEIHELEIKRHFGHAYFFRDKTFGLPRD